MRFMLLVCVGNTGPAIPQEGDPTSWVEEMTARNVRLHGFELRGVKEAATVRRRGGEILITEGPFAETAEQIAGYDVIDCADFDEAVEIAAKHPVAAFGSIEIRPFYPVDEGVTGATTSVELEVDVPLERMWELVSDVTRIGEWSPECVHAAWLDGHDGPKVGARFEGTNRFPHGDSHVTCVVTAAEAPTVFAWDVLDSQGAQSSTWRYELEPGSTPGRTLVRHTFTHGPGRSGLRAAVWEYTIHEDAIRDRLAMLHDNMTTTIRAMATG